MLARLPLEEQLQLIGGETEGWMGGWVERWTWWIPSWLMLARSPLENQLRPIGGGMEAWKGGGVNGVDGVDELSDNLG